MRALLQQLFLQAAAVSWLLAAAVADEPAGCGPGFQLSASMCVDVNECKLVLLRRGERRDVCSNFLDSHRPGFRCVNTPGSYLCHRTADCGFGYTLNDTTGECEDTNECEELDYDKACGTPLSLPLKVCINMPGTFRCEFRRCGSDRYLDRNSGKCLRCPRGFRRNSRNLCEDVDECQRPVLNDCRPHQRCANYNGSYECKDRILCSTGMRHNYNGTECIDKDECAENLGVCKIGYECKNTVGSYDCVPKRCGKLRRLDFSSGTCVCVIGFRHSSSSGECVDVNECAEGTHRCSEAEACRNTRGSHQCISRDRACGPGFAHDMNWNCVDVNECVIGTYTCGANQFCFNTNGSYECRCYTGFRRRGAACEDIDECRSPHACGTNFVCTNMPGTYNCSCRSGFQQQDASVCVDIDECSTQQGLCAPGDCVNTAGAYKCECPIGYYQDGEPPECVDTDECQLADTCPGSIGCVNTLGGYRCNCRSGLAWNWTLMRCEDLNECDTGQCGAGLSCFNYRGGFACYNASCPDGFSFSRRLTSGFRCQSTRGCTEVWLGSRKICASSYQWEEKVLREANADWMTVHTVWRQQSQLRRCLHAATVVADGRNRTETEASGGSRFRFLQTQQGAFVSCSTSVRGSAYPQLQGAVLGTGVQHTDAKFEALFHRLHVAQQ